MYATAIFNGSTDSGSDPADLGSRQTEIDLQVAMLNHRYRANRLRLTPKSSCYFCDESLPHPQALFCDADCREDYEKLQRQKRISGLI
ncbi:DUF2116 family Zn-ribbon domain-containing protein [Ectothiorhodospiraceae bacterium BW-2]|nr:DUF2116 family Zn-ribbon domain-containing protein [Ectothiorhodospiraceae bacterium BW-2]